MEAMLRPGGDDPAETPGNSWGYSSPLAELRAKRDRVLKRKGFNPAEPRDSSGEWTGGGGSSKPVDLDVLGRPVPEGKPTESSAAPEGTYHAHHCHWCSGDASTDPDDPEGQATYGIIPGWGLPLRAPSTQQSYGVSPSPGRWSLSTKTTWWRSR
jgi:hypothetical protein